MANLGLLIGLDESYSDSLTNMTIVFPLFDEFGALFTLLCDALLYITIIEVQVHLLRQLIMF